jgi:anti-sigma factor RsiW
MLMFAKDYECREMVELVTEYLEGTLAPRRRRRFEAHLSGCPHCTEYLRQMRVTIAATGRLRAESLSEEMRGELMAVYRRWRSEEG